MKGKKHAPKMTLDMDFGEALERYIRSDPKEVDGNIERSKKKKPRRAKKRPRRGSQVTKNVVTLRDARRKRYYG